MILILFRLAIMIAVLGGATFGVVYAIKRHLSSRALAGIRKEIRALNAGREEGLLNGIECDELTEKIRQKCIEQGIDFDAETQTRNDK